MYADEFMGRKRKKYFGMFAREIFMNYWQERKMMTNLKLIDNLLILVKCVFCHHKCLICKFFFQSRFIAKKIQIY